MGRAAPGADSDPAAWSRARLMLPALPFAIIAAIGVSRIVAGPGWGLLPLLAVGPAGAAGAGAPLSTPRPGALAPGGGLPFAVGIPPGPPPPPARAAFLPLGGVTAARRA